MIKFLDLQQINMRFDADIRAAVERVVESGWYILADECSGFEREFAEFCNAEQCVSVANGLDALILSLRALEVGPGDEVIVPSNTFIAKEFQGHFRRLGLRGAMIGGLAAIAFFAIASLLSFWWAHSPGGDEIAAMFGSFTLGASGYIALAVVCAAVTLLTGLLSRVIVMRHLQRLQ